MKKILIALFVVLVPTLAFAAEISSGQTISLEKSQKNPIIFSTTANIKSDVEGDLTVFAQNINIDNPVSGSAYVFGQSANVNSTIGNRLVVACADAVINSQIKGDLIVVGSNITLGKSAKIDGDVIAYGNIVNISGQIDGKLSTGGSKVVLDGALVKGSATIQSDQISLSDNSQLSGSLKYKSSREMSLPDSRVLGGIEFEKTKQQKSNQAYSLIGSMVMLIIAGLILMWFVKDKLDDLVVHSTRNLGKVWLSGFLASLIAPLIMMFLIVSYVGIYAFVILLLLYILAWVIGYVYGAILLGHTLVRLISQSKTKKVEWASVVFGPMMIVLISLIPVIGGLIKFVLSVAGVGMFIEQLKTLKANK